MIYQQNLLISQKQILKIGLNTAIKNYNLYFKYILV